MEKQTSWALLLAALVAVACNAPEPPGNTGGTNVDGGACGRGLVVIDTDYNSTNVSLLGVDGTLLSSSLVSSASTGTGLSEPLTGDVVTPTEAENGATLLLMDRYPASVLTWVSVASGAVTAQLRVGNGFAGNPQDYVLLAPDKAYVPRYEPNTDPGRAPFDSGNDVLIVDPRGPSPSITGSIDMTPAMGGEDPRFYPRANRAIEVGGSVYVLLAGYSRDWSDSAESRLVRIDPDKDAIAEVFKLGGLHGCGALALSPGGDELAIACSGMFEKSSNADIAGSAVVRVALGDNMTETARYLATSLGAGPVAFGIDYVSADKLLVTTFGDMGDLGHPPADDTAQELDLASGASTLLLRSHSTPFSLGEVRCARACGACFVTDAESGGGVVHRFEIDAGGALANDRTIAPDPQIGMPPRNLGLF